MNVKSLLALCQQTARKKNLSLGRLGRELNVDRAQISHWFSGRYKPSSERLFALIEAVGLKLSISEARESQNSGDIEPIAAQDASRQDHPEQTNRPNEAIHQKPIRRAPAFENLTSAELETARQLFGLELSANR